MVSVAAALAAVGMTDALAGSHDLSNLSPHEAFEASLNEAIGSITAVAQTAFELGLDVSKVSGRG